MGETETKEESEDLKEIKTEAVTFQGKLNLSKLLDPKMHEAFKKEMGKELMIPMIVFAFKEKKLILISYDGPEAYKNGKATLIGQKAEDVKEFYASLKKLLL